MHRATRALLRCRRGYRNAIPGQAFVVALVSTWVSASCSSKYVTIRVTFGFTSKKIQSEYFKELVQFDHLKSCPSDSNNTGILVIIDHFSPFAEAVPCSHEDCDTVTTSRLLLQKWFARHGTPTRMQFDNAPNLTAEVSNEFMRASQVTKVNSTAG